MASLSSRISCKLLYLSSSNNYTSMHSLHGSLFKIRIGNQVSERMRLGSGKLDIRFIKQETLKNHVDYRTFCSPDDKL